jgi:hypothetical protein
MARVSHICLPFRRCRIRVQLLHRPSARARGCALLTTNRCAPPHGSTTVVAASFFSPAFRPRHCRSATRPLPRLPPVRRDPERVPSPGPQLLSPPPSFPPPSAPTTAVLPRARSLDCRPYVEIPSECQVQGEAPDEALKLEHA